MNPNFQDQDQQQLAQGMDPSGDPSVAEQDYSFMEEKKPMNRNLLALLAIVVVGGGLVYFMHLRSAKEIETDPAVLENQEKVEKFLADGKKSIDQVGAMLEKTQEVVAVIGKDNGQGQIPTENLRVNPFQTDGQAPPPDTRKGGQEIISTDPAASIRAILSKVQVQAIMYSANGSSSAMVGSHVCSEGGKVTLGGVAFTVKQITPDTVVLKHPSGEFSLGLKDKSSLSTQRK